MKLLCVSTKKSVRAVVHTPAPTVVGMRYSRGVLRVKEGSRNFSFTLRRAGIMWMCGRKRKEEVCVCEGRGRISVNVVLVPCTCCAAYVSREEMRVYKIGKKITMVP